MLKPIQKTFDWLNRQNHIVLALLIFAIFVLISWLVRDARPLACDMAEYMNNPLRILNGDMPYRDFWLLFPPGEVYFPAFVYDFFGQNTDTLRFATILTSCLIPVAGFYLGRELFGKNTKALVVAMLMYFTSVVSNYEGPDYLHLYLFFIILATIFLVRHFRTGEKYGLVLLAGIMMGFAFLFKLYEVGGVYVAYMITLGAYPAAVKNDRKSILAGPILLLGGTALVGIVLVWSMGDLTWLMINELVFESVKNGTSMNLSYFNELGYVLNSISNDFNSLTSGGGVGAVLYLGYHLLRLIVETGYYVVPFIAIVIYFLFIYKNPDKRTVYISTLIFLWGVMSFPKALGRSDIAHLAPSVAPFLVFILYAGVKQLNKRYLKSIAYVVVSLMLLSISFPAFKYLSIKMNPIKYVETERGNVPFKTLEDKNDLQMTLEFLSEHTNEDDYIFVTPWDAAPIYALTGLRNPTYYDSLNDLMIRRNVAKQKKIIVDLKVNKTKFIVHNADWGYDNKPEQQFRTACSVLQEFIEKECYEVASFGFYTIYSLNEMN